jgi:hypothetical protein
MPRSCSLESLVCASQGKSPCNSGSYSNYRAPSTGVRSIPSASRANRRLLPRPEVRQRKTTTKATAGPSTPLRFAQDDRSYCVFGVNHRLFGNNDKQPQILRCAQDDSCACDTGRLDLTAEIPSGQHRSPPSARMRMIFGALWYKRLIESSEKWRCALSSSGFRRPGKGYRGSACSRNGSPGAGALGLGQRATVTAFVSR